MPVLSGGANLDFKPSDPLTYQALLYELRDKGTPGQPSTIVPNWFGVAIPDPEHFDLSSDVYVVLYFHPIPGQAHFRDQDYFDKTGTGTGTQEGTDWKQLYAYVDRLGGQMAGAIKSGAPANNRLVIFPFLKSAQYTLPTSEWFNIIHDILQDININVVPRICTKKKKIIVATLSNGSFFLNKFLDEASGPNKDAIIEVWDFDSEISRNPQILVKPRGKRLRAYWQNSHQNTGNETYIHLPPTSPSWVRFPTDDPTLNNERPPLPPLPSNSNPLNGRDTDTATLHHHYIRDTMFLDAAFNIENDNP